MLSKIIKNIFILFLLLSLFGCNEVNKDEIISEYNNVYNSFNNIQSFDVSLESEFVVLRKLNKDSDNILESINYIIDGNLVKEGKNYSSSYLTNFENIKTWYIDRILYLDNSGYKISYKDNLSNYFNQSKLYYSIIPINLTKEDILDIKKASIIDGLSYEFILSETGFNKLFETDIFNNIGYDFELFEIESVDSSYTVDIVNGNIEEINIKGNIEGEFVNEYICIEFNSEINYKGINSTKLNVPNDLSEFNLSENTSNGIHNVNNLNDFIQYLLDVGYLKNDDNTYSIEINDDAKYVYDFENKIYSYIYKGNTYVYDWTKDYGYNDLCNYDLMNNNILEGYCSNMQIFYLKANKNSFLYDIKGSGTVDYNVFDIK